jgi:ribosomal protein L11 methyltransferase
MTAGFWEVETEVDEALADDAGALLVGAGAAGVEVVTAGGPPSAPGFEGRPRPAAGRATVVATWVDDRPPEEVRADATAALTEIGLAGAPLTLRRRDDQDWAERWKQFYQPLQFGDLWVVPAWLEAPPGARHVLTMDPGMAFGTGQHATTALCLDVLASRPAAPSLIDVGCGSGILAIAAAKLGVRRLLAIDNDPEAVRATRENALQNRVELEAGETPVGEVSEKFAVVVANILSSVLISLARDITARLERGGTLILSGILAVEADEVVAAYAPLRLVERRDRQEWVVLVLQA